MTNKEQTESKSVPKPQGRSRRKPPAPEALGPAAEEMLRALEERGVPSGAWLVDIARARHALQEADSILRRLEDAIIRAARTSPLDER